MSTTNIPTFTPSILSATLPPMSIWATKLWIDEDSPLGTPYRDTEPARLPNSALDLATTALMDSRWVRLTLIENMNLENEVEVEVWLSPEQSRALRDALNEALND